MKTKPFFDPEGNLYIPNDIPFCGMMNPPLLAKEWMFYIFYLAGNIPDGYLKNSFGTKQTQQRYINKLIKKGYIPKGFKVSGLSGKDEHASTMDKGKTKVFYEPEIEKHLKKVLVDAICDAIINSKEICLCKNKKK